MSSRGADWYKREPQAYLGGVIGLRAQQHAVYSITLDLIYEHGGSCPNDPKWISGWIRDMGPASVRRAIGELVALGKLVIVGDRLTNPRARNEANTARDLREKRAKSGEKGGKTGKNQAKNTSEFESASAAIKDLAEASASERSAPDKTRVEKNIGGGGDARTHTHARARETARPPKDDSIPVDPPEDRAEQDPEVATLVALRDRLVDMIGIDVGKSRKPARWFGSESLDTIRQWVNLRLTGEEIVETVSEVMANKPDGPPKTLSYFNEAMQRRAGRKQQPDLVPISGTPPQQRRSRADDRFARVIGRFADPEDGEASGPEVAGGEGEDAPQPLLPPRAVRG